MDIRGLFEPGWRLACRLAGLHGTGLPFHVQIASLPFIPLLTVYVGGGRVWLALGCGRQLK